VGEPETDVVAVKLTNELPVIVGKEVIVVEEEADAVEKPVAELVSEPETDGVAVKLTNELPVIVGKEVIVVEIEADAV